MNFNNSINSLSGALDAYSLRQKVISNNIANVETPNYKRKDVKFDSVLKDAMGNDGKLTGTITNENHIPINSTVSAVPTVYEDTATKSRMDGNNVDIDVEMGELSKNYVKYNVAAQQLSGAFRKIKTAIGTGGR